MDWIRLVQDRHQWRDVVNTVMNFGFHKMLGNSLIAERLAVSQEAFDYMELGGWLCYIFG
jgi:hypothetical protein